MAFQLVKHAFFMIWRNLGQALKISLIPTVIFFGMMMIFLFVFGLSAGEQAANPIFMLIVGPILIAAGLFWIGWVAVSWHRFVLLEEYVGFLPPTKDRPIWRYAGRVVLYGLALSLAILPVFFVFGFLLAGLPAVVSMILFLVIAVLTSVVWMRWAITLPGIAVGKNLELFEGWRNTDAFNGTIVGVVAILFGLNFLVSIVLTLLIIPFMSIGTGAVFLVQLISFVVQWFTSMMGLSILTTLYGHIYEGRQLSD